MGMGWKDKAGGLHDRCKCKCGKGEVLIYISDHEESEYPPFTRGDSYSGSTTCPDGCINIEKMSQNELQYYRALNR